MRFALFALALICSIHLNAHTQFRLNDASKIVDIDIDVGKCEEEIQQGLCGPLKVRFFRKKARRAFQTITLPQTDVWDPVPKANVTRRYDDQSIINFGDFNFDGFEDVAICDGTNGGYGMPSYRIYLYSQPRKRFVYSRSFTKMNHGGLGMFETDKKKRMHFAFFKSTCCWHQTQGFDVYRGRPRKMYVFTEDLWMDTVEITTEKLINGRWRKWIKHAKGSEYYKN
jgi:hypothetical protein